MSEHNVFDSEKLAMFYCAPDVASIPTSGLWISSPALYLLNHPVMNMDITSTLNLS